MGLIDAVVVGFISLLIGGFGIWAGARLLIDENASYGKAFVTALIGAVVWGLLSFLGGIPLVGPLLLLIIWVAIINWSYPGGWLTATGIGVVAWIVAVGVMYALAILNIVTFEALGIPGV